MRRIVHTGDLIKAAQRLSVIAFCFYLLTYPVCSQTGREETRIDSLKNLLEQTHGAERVSMLLEISQAKWYVSFEESMNYATKAFNLAEELNYPEGKADALNRIGNVHYFLRNYSDVIDNYNMAYQIARSLDDYRRMGIYLNNIGILYRELRQYDSSEIYLVKALREKEQYGDKTLTASTLNNLGVLYRDRQRYSLSLEYFVRQLDILEENRDIRNLAQIHRQTGEVFHLLNRLNEAINHFMRSLSYAAELNDSNSISLAYYNLGRACFDMDRLDEALENINQSLKIANTISSQTIQRNNYHLLYLYNRRTNNQQAALSYLVRHSNLKDSIRNQRSASQYRELERIFETENQKNKIELLHKEIQIQDLMIKRQDNLKTTLIILVITLIIITMIIATSLLLRQKTNKLLNQKILELETTNEKLRQSALSLEQLNATKNRFFSIIAHDLKNPFNALLGFSEMIAKKFNQLSEQSIREYINIIHQSSQNLYKLLENLLKWSAAQTGTMHYLPEKFDLVSLIHSEINFLRLSAGKKQIRITASLPDEIIINSDKLMLSSVIRNLLDNAIKFTNPGGSISISTAQRDGQIITEVIDTGIGIPEDIQDKIFIIDENTCRKGTNNEPGGGLGLILCKELIEKSGGTIGFSSKPGEGSHFWFTQPN